MTPTHGFGLILAAIVLPRMFWPLLESAMGLW
jgi:hypothetical protein